MVNINQLQPPIQSLPQNNIGATVPIPQTRKKVRLSELQPVQTGVTNTQIMERQQMIEQGVPVSTERRFERTGETSPTFGGEIVRNVIRPFAQVAASATDIESALDRKPQEGLQSEYLGQVDRVGKGFDITSMRPESVRGALSAAGTGLELASNIPIARGASTVAKTVTGALRSPGRQASLLTRLSSQPISGPAFEGGVSGALSESGKQLQEQRFNPLKIIGSGALGGAAGAGLGTAGAGISRVRSFFTGQTEKEAKNILENAIQRGIDKGFKPTKRQKGSIIERQAKEGIKELVRQGDQITFADMQTTGIPDDVKSTELPDAIDKAMRNIYNEFNSELKKANSAGILVDTQPVVQKLIQIVNSNRTQEVRRYAESLINEITRLQNASPLQIQEYLQDINKKFASFIVSGKGALQRSVDIEIAKLLNQTIENALEKSAIPGIKPLKSRYAGLKSLRELVANQAAKEARKSGIDILSVGQPEDVGVLLYGALTANPGLVASSATSQLFRSVLRRIADPERIIQNMFKTLKKQKEKFPQLFEIQRKNIDIIPPQRRLGPGPIITPAPKNSDSVRVFSGTPPEFMIGSYTRLPAVIPNEVSRKINKPIQLPKESQSTIDAREIKRIQDARNATLE